MKSCNLYDVTKWRSHGHSGPFYTPQSTELLPALTQFDDTVCTLCYTHYAIRLDILLMRWFTCARWILRASPSPLSCCSLPPESPPVAVFRGAGGGVLLEESCQSLRPWSNETDRNSYSTFSMISDRINYWMSQALFIAWTSLLLILFTRCNATSLSWP